MIVTRFTFMDLLVQAIARLPSAKFETLLASLDIVDIVDLVELRPEEIYNWR